MGVKEEQQRMKWKCAKTAAALDSSENPVLGTEIKSQQKVQENSQKVSSVGLDARDCTERFPQKAVRADLHSILT